MRSRLGIVVIAGILLGFLASCGGGGPEKLTAKTLFPRMSKAQAEAKTSQISMRMNAPGGQTVKSYGQMKLGKRAEDTAMAMTVSGETGGLGDIEMRLIDRTLYVALGAVTQDKFAEIDLRDKSNPMAQQFAEMMNVDPASQFRRYQGAITKFDSSGKTVKIDDIETQPYAVSIDPSKAAESTARKGVELPKSVNLTLYVGTDDLPRRMVSTVPGPGGQSRIQMDYTKWGEKVTIKAPAKADIVKDSLFDRIGGGAPTPAPVQ